MKSLERRYKIRVDKKPYCSSLVNFSEAVAYQRFSKETIVKWFYELVDEEDYQKRDKDDIIAHLVWLSNTQKPAEEPANPG